MLRCPNCHHEQEVGKFCGKCGSPVEEVVAENENIEEGVSHDASNEVPETEVLVTEQLEEKAVTQEVEQTVVQPVVEDPAKQKQQQQQQQQPQQFQQQQAAQRPDPFEPATSINIDDVKKNAVKY